MRSVFRLLVCLIVIASVWLFAFGWYIASFTAYPAKPERNAEAIIVLTGGGGRVEYGLDLLAHGQGNALFISGVDKTVPLGALMAKAPVATRAALALLSGNQITVGRDARNTIGNAEESAAWVKAGHYKSILLVTADYHMPRSLIEFRQALPGVEFIPAVVVTKSYHSFAWVNDADMRNLLLAEFHKLIAAKLRHMLFFDKGIS